MYFTLFDSGRVVSDAVILAGPKLLRNGVVAIFLSVGFGIIAFTVFRDEIRSEDGPCQTAYNCIGQAMVSGWEGGNIAPVLLPGFLSNLASFIPTRIEDDSIDQVRIFLIFIYWVAWNLIIINIFAALLLDAFANIRGTMVERAKDEQERCLVCSLPKKQFDDRLGDGAFQRHIEGEHRCVS